MSKLSKYDEVATANIISAEEALQRFFIYGNTLPGPGSIMGEVYIPSATAFVKKIWLRPFPLEKKVTYFGYLSIMEKSITGGPWITLDGYIVTGNIKGISADTQSSCIEAIGMFHDIDGVKTFEMDSWKKYEGNYGPYHGTIQREGDQVVIHTDEGKKLTLPDIPRDLSLPAADMSLEGVEQDGALNWKRLANYSDPLSGGGRGALASDGYYKINMTGNPVPFAPVSTPTPLPPQTYLPKPVVGLRGKVSIDIYQKSDGSERVSYAFFPRDKDFLNAYSSYTILEGDSLDGLKKYQNRQVNIWGTVRFDGPTGATIINVERYEDPYPNVQFQLIKGTHKAATVDGQSVMLFTTEDNISYVQRYLTYNGAVDAMQGEAGGGPLAPVILEGYIIPDETFGEYPVIYFYNIFPAVDPTTGKPGEYKITAGDPNIVKVDKDVPVSATIEKIDLVYFTPNRYFYTPNPSSDRHMFNPCGASMVIMITAMRFRFSSRR